MAEQPAGLAGLDEALEQVVAAARAHLAAVRAAGGAADDTGVWRSYLALGHASYAYDQLLLQAYGEATPWEAEPVGPAGGGDRPPLVAGPDGPVGELPADPHPGVVSVRQRRDYRVPSVAALLAAGTAGDRGPAPGSVADAVLALVGGGDGSLASLDLPELELVRGVVTVVEVPGPLPPEAADPALFEVGTGQRQVGRLDEQALLPEPAGSGAGDGQ